MSAISFGGLSTGLDTGSIVAQLVALRRQPIVQLEARKTLLERQRTALSDLKSKLLAIQKAAEKLDTTQEFASLNAVSSNEDVVRATAGGDATEGSYEIVVSTVAKAQKDLSQGFASQVTEVGAGTVTITVGGVQTQVTLEAGASSLTHLRDAINEAGAGVRATILNDGSATTPYRLVLTAETTGTDAAFSVDFSGLSGGTAPVMTNLNPASNASLTIDGVPITSQTNTLSETIGGLSLTLQKAAPTETITLAVTVDGDGIAGKIQELVDAYNDFMNYVEGQKLEGATLRGHSLVRSLSSRVATLMSSALGTGTGAYRLMAQIGVSQTDDNLIEFDRAKFDEALATDYGAVRDLLVERGTNLGKAYLLRQDIDALTTGDRNVFEITTDAIGDKMEQIDDRIERYERSVESYQAVLERQFTAMEMLVSNLQAQGSFITANFYRSNSSH